MSADRMEMVRLAGTPTGVPVGFPLVGFKKSKDFENDYFLVKHTRQAAIREFWRLLEILRSEQFHLLDPGYEHHHMNGRWLGWQNCHVEGDLVLLFCYTTEQGKKTLLLGRFGTHSKLGI